LKVREAWKNRRAYFARRLSSQSSGLAASRFGAKAACVCRTGDEGRKAGQNGPANLFFAAKPPSKRGFAGKRGCERAWRERGKERTRAAIAPIKRLAFGSKPRQKTNAGRPGGSLVVFGRGGGSGVDGGFFALCFAFFRLIEQIAQFFWIGAILRHSDAPACVV